MDEGYPEVLPGVGPSRTAQRKSDLRNLVDLQSMEKERKEAGNQP